MHPNNLDWKTYWLLEHLTQFHTITVKIQTHFQDQKSDSKKYTLSHKHKGNA